MVFWAINYKNFGGKNGVLGMVYLCGVYFVMGFAEWAWAKWDQDFENWWLGLVGKTNTQWDSLLLSLFTFAGWGIALLA
jgi:hypothetical protein